MNLFGELLLHVVKLAKGAQEELGLLRLDFVELGLELLVLRPARFGVRFVRDVPKRLDDLFGGRNPFLLDGFEVVRRASLRRREEDKD